MYWASILMMRGAAGVEDAAMNYMGFALPVRGFLAGLDVAHHPVRMPAAECAQWMGRATGQACHMAAS